MEPVSTKPKAMHIGEAIKQELERQGKTVVWFAEQLPCHRTNVYRLLEKRTIDTGTLLNICKILNHDFFADLAQEYEKRKCS